MGDTYSEGEETVFADKLTINCGGVIGACSAINIDKQEVKHFELNNISYMNNGESMSSVNHNQSKIVVSVTFDTMKDFNFTKKNRGSYYLTISHLSVENSCFPFGAKEFEAHIKIDDDEMIDIVDEVWLNTRKYSNRFPKDSDIVN